MQPTRFDQVSPPQDKPAGLRTAQILATAEDRQIRAHLRKVPQVADWRQLSSSIDHHRDTARPGNLDHICQRQISRCGHDALKPEECRRPIRDRLLQIRARRSRGVANLNDLRPNLPNRIVIAISMRAMHDNFVFQPGQVRDSP